MNEVSGNVLTTQKITGSISSDGDLAGEVSVTGGAGIVGPTPNIHIGTTSTLEAGQEAYVELDPNSTRLNPIFNFGIPKGEPGLQGENGYTPVKGVDYFTEEDIASLNIVSKEYVDEAIANAELGGDVDLSNYYTKEEVDNKIPSLEEYALKNEIPDVSKFQTEEQVAALINEAIGGIENGSY
jgi:hypothetical protein